jgi:hypothetical protein
MFHQVRQGFSDRTEPWSRCCSIAAANRRNISPLRSAAWRIGDIVGARARPTAAAVASLTTTTVNAGSAPHCPEG